MSCFSSCCPTEFGKHQVLSFSWVEKKPLVRWRRNWARNWSRGWRVLCFQRPLLPCIPFINLFTELLIKLSFVFIHCMEQLVCFKQLTFSVIFVHSIKPEIRCMIQVHVMTDNLVSVTYIWVLKAVWVSQSIWKQYVFSLVFYLR